MADLARGTVLDRPWGRTLAALGLRGVTGQLTVISDAKPYRIVFSQGAVVAASSPLTSDAAVRIALTGHLISSTQVADIARKQAAAPNRDEIEVIAELARLQPEQAMRLRRRVTAQRAARTFSIAKGDFVVRDEVELPIIAGTELDIRTVIYLGAKQMLSEGRLNGDLAGFGGWFQIRPECVEDLPQYGFGVDEHEIVELLKRGAGFSEMERPGSDVRVVRAVTYALVSCNEAIADPTRASNRTPTSPPRSKEASGPIRTRDGSGPRTAAPTSSPRIAPPRERIATPTGSARIATPAPPAPDEGYETSTPPHGVSRRPNPGFETATPAHGSRTPAHGVRANAGFETSTPTTAQPVFETTTPAPAPPHMRRGEPTTPIPSIEGLPSRPGTPTTPLPLSGVPQAVTKEPTTPMAGPATAGAVTRARPTSAPPRTTRPTPTAGSPALSRPIDVKQTSEVHTLIEQRLTILNSKGDHFALLGLPREATMAQIRDAYFVLARQLHPDRLSALGIPDEHRRAQRLFAEVNNAFAVLSDKAKRERYVDILNRGGEAAIKAEQQKAEEMAMRILESEEAFRRGEMALKRDSLATAIRELERAIQLNPDEPDYHATLAWAKFAAAPDKMAVATATRTQLEQAIRKSPRANTGRFYLGRVERMLGKDQKALELFQEVLRMDPNHAEATSEVRVLEARLGSDKGGLFGRLKR